MVSSYANPIKDFSYRFGQPNNDLYFRCRIWDSVGDYLMEQSIGLFEGTRISKTFGSFSYYIWFWTTEQKEMFASIVTSYISIDVVSKMDIYEENEHYCRIYRHLYLENGHIRWEWVVISYILADVVSRMDISKESTVSLLLSMYGHREILIHINSIHWVMFISNKNMFEFGRI